MFVTEFDCKRLIEVICFLAFISKKYSTRKETVFVLHYMLNDFPLKFLWSL